VALVLLVIKITGLCICSIQWSRFTWKTRTNISKMCTFSSHTAPSPSKC